ncbi:MAG TPA: acylneuraminate cytidylyltransferase family protein [Phycisphaerae bacterium]|nr:acylneuraminate cytidylyltransferase family protein [Phycisphaerae bacterium]
MATAPHILAVIMARAGSVGLPNKSLRPLLGKPVLAYTLDHARQSTLITRTIVSSDSPDILALAHSEGFETLLRPPELATAASATDPVLRHAVRSLYPHSFETTENTEAEKIKNPISVPSVSSVVNSDLPRAIVMLYGNVPIRTDNMIDRCIQMLLDTGADSVQTIASVGKFHPYWMFDLNPNSNQIQKHIPNTIFRRQDLPPLYSPTGAVYVMKTGVLMQAENHPEDPHAFLGADRRGLIVSPEDSVDIDTEKDLYLAEAMLRAQQNPTRPQMLINEHK